MSSLQKVQKIIADALYVELKECVKDALLVEDLGAESIDFLDITFRLEQEFNIRLPKGEIEKKIRGGLSEEEFAVGGVIQPRAIDNLLRVLPEVPRDRLAGLNVRDLPSLFTVQTFAAMVDEKLGEIESMGPREDLLGRSLYT